MKNFFDRGFEDKISDTLPYVYFNHLNGEEKISRAFLKNFGVNETHKNISDLYHLFNEDDFARLETTIRKDNDGITHASLRSSDSKKFYDCLIRQFYNSKGLITSTLLVFLDNTEKTISTLEAKSLKLQYKELSEIINNIDIPIWKRDSNLKIKYFNNAYGKNLGTSLEKIDENSELSPEVKTLSQEAKTKNEKQSKQLHAIINKQRKLLNVTELPLAEGGNLGFAYDISQLEDITHELKRYSDAQSSILESLTAATAIFDKDTRLKFYNSAFVNLWGAEERFLDSEPTFSEVLENLREKRKLPEQANFSEFKNKRIKLFNDLIMPHEEFFYLPDDRTLRVIYIPYALGGLLISFENITDRLALERSFKTLSVVQRTTLENLHEGIVVFGQDGRIKLFNPKYIKLWNLQPEFLASSPHISEVLEKTKNLYKITEDWPTYKTKTISLIESRSHKTEKLNRTDGIVLEWQLVPLPDGATLITYHDITDSYLVEKSLRERYEALEQVDTIKSKFLTNVSYELRSPLTNIKGYAEMLSNPVYSGALSGKQKVYIDEIISAANRLSGLIDSVLDIASVEAGYMKLKIKEFFVSDLVKEVYEENKEKTRAFDFTFENPKDNLMIKGDYNRVRQVLNSLVDNSTKFTPEKGKITIKAIETDDYVKIIISDTGIGIKKEYQESVFKKFTKFSPIVKNSNSTGFGLGLSIAKSIVELHGGFIELSSEPETGTTITCNFKK